MRPCGKNRYTTEEDARAAFGCHPKRKNEPYVIVRHAPCGGWHIVAESEERRFTGWQPNTPAAPVPTVPARWRGWYNCGAYTAGDALEYDGQAWLAVVNWTMDRPGSSDSWREILSCMGEPYCPAKGTPGDCGPPCHAPSCPVHQPAPCAIS